MKPLLAFLLLLTLVGCMAPVGTPAPDWGQDPVAIGHRLIAQAPPRDRMLWRYRVAAVALKHGQYAQARDLLDTALRAVERSHTFHTQARDARGLFTSERAKVFLGEPYERAMAYYYRGILYWMDGELDNARACFRAGQYHDGDAADREHRGDWALLDYLDALATAKLRGDAAPLLARARAHARLSSLRDLAPKDNVLIFAQFGFGPLKRASGPEGGRLVYTGGFADARAALIRVNGRGVRVPLFDEVGWQARTRGRRQVAEVLDTKAAFKQSASRAGDLGLAGGSVLARAPQMRTAAVGLMAVGTGAKAVAGATQPRADTRTWDNLPQYIGFGSLRLPPGRHRATVDFVNAAGRVLADLRRQLEIEVKPRGDTVVFVADQ